jgi:hypothetical protein
MKLENQQSYITNAQFAGGRPIGSGSYGVPNTTYAKAIIDLSSVARYTGSFQITNAFGETSVYYLSGSNSSSVDPTTGASFIPVSSSVNNTLVSIRNFLNASASAVLQNVTTNAANLQVTSSINGRAGNSVFFNYGAYSGSVVTGSTTATLSGAQGASDYPMAFGFVAGGLYIGRAGDLVATTVDNSVLTFISASGFVPGVFKSVSNASTVSSVIALK